MKSTLTCVLGSEAAGPAASRRWKSAQGHGGRIGKLPEALAAEIGEGGPRCNEGEGSERHCAFTWKSKLTETCMASRFECAVMTGVCISNFTGCDGATFSNNRVRRYTCRIFIISCLKYIFY